MRKLFIIAAMSFGLFGAAQAADGHISKAQNFTTLDYAQSETVAAFDGEASVTPVYYHGSRRFNSHHGHYKYGKSFHSKGYYGGGRGFKGKGFRGSRGFRSSRSFRGKSFRSSRRGHSSRRSFRR